MGSSANRCELVGVPRAFGRVTLAHPVCWASHSIWSKSNAAPLPQSESRRCEIPGGGLWLRQRTRYRCCSFWDKTQAWSFQKYAPGIGQFSDRPTATIQTEHYQKADRRARGTHRCGSGIRWLSALADQRQRMGESQRSAACLCFCGATIAAVDEHIGSAHRGVGA